MAWRPYDEVVEGILDNTVLGKVTGYIKFAGMKKAVMFNLKGDFHRDIRGTKLKFVGDGEESRPGRMDGFALIQKGNVGDITAGIPTGKDDKGEYTYEYSAYPYIEWYSDENGRVVLEFDAEQVEIIGTPIPVCESDPIDRKEQYKNMGNFMINMLNNLGKKKEE